MEVISMIIGWALLILFLGFMVLCFMYDYGQGYKHSKYIHKFDREGLIISKVYYDELRSGKFESFQTRFEETDKKLKDYQAGIITFEEYEKQINLTYNSKSSNSLEDLNEKVAIPYDDIILWKRMKGNYTPRVLIELAGIENAITITDSVSDSNNIWRVISSLKKYAREKRIKTEDDKVTVFNIIAFVVFIIKDL